MRDIYINFNLDPPTKFNSNSRKIELKDILPWNISQMITKTIPTSLRIVISYVIETVRVGVRVTARDPSRKLTI